VIVAADTYIFVLLIYAFHKSHPSEKWFVKIEKNRYLDIGDICKTYGEEICAENRDSPSKMLRRS